MCYRYASYLIRAVKLAEMHCRLVHFINYSLSFPRVHFSGFGFFCFLDGPCLRLLGGSYSDLPHRRIMPTLIFLFCVVEFMMSLSGITLMSFYVLFSMSFSQQRMPFSLSSLYFLCLDHGLLRLFTPLLFSMCRFIAALLVAGFLVFLNIVV